MKRYIALMAVAAVFAGCGGSPTAAQRAEAHLAAVANPICRYVKVRQESTGYGPGAEARVRAEIARVRALLRSDRNLPRVAAYVSDLKTRKRLRAELTKLHRTGYTPGNSFSILDEIYRADVKVQADLKALGLTSCIGRPPRKPISG